MNKLKVSDKVIILSGKEKSKTGQIKSINYKTNRLVINGLNIVKKSIKPTQQNPQGGFSEIEKSIHISNVALLSPKTLKATKVGFKTVGDKKVRFSRKFKSDLK
jgi:large subunit ribosomal protein L24